MPKWWHVSGKRLGKALLIVFLTPLLLGILAILVQIQLAPWRIVRVLSSTDTELNLVPTALPDTSVAVLSGERIERFGFSIQLPWKQLDYDDTLDNFVTLSSKNQGFMRISNPSSGLFSDLRKYRLTHLARASNDGLLHSNYALAIAAMATKPQQIKWWKTARQNSKDLNLLSIKFMIQNLCRGGVLYAVNFGKVRGFQQGSPSVAPYCVQLDLFDNADIRYEITIETGKGGPAMTQSEINAIIASLHPISH